MAENPKPGAGGAIETDGVKRFIELFHMLMGTEGTEGAAATGSMSDPRAQEAYTETRPSPSHVVISGNQARKMLDPGPHATDPMADPRAQEAYTEARPSPSHVVISGNQARKMLDPSTRNPNLMAALSKRGAK